MISARAKISIPLYKFNLWQNFHGPVSAIAASFLHLIDVFFFRYYGDLDATIPTIYETLDDILSRCGIKHKTEDPANFPPKLSEAKNGPKLSFTLQQLEDIVLYLNDTTETLLAFLGTYTPICESFHRQGFVQRIACFYELITPYFRLHFTDVESRVSKEKWKLVKVVLIKICRVILNTCCVGPLESR